VLAAAVATRHNGAMRARRSPWIALVGCVVAAACALAPATPAPAPASPPAADARTAVPTYLAGDLSADELEGLRREVPGLRVLACASRDDALALASEADGVEASLVTPEFLARATKLRWVQAMSAGVERWLALPGIANADRIVLTNMRGAHGPAIADHVFALLLAGTRDLRHRFAQQAAATWDPKGSGALTVALQGRTLLVVGLGGIGSEVARRAHGFEMRVLATRRSDAPAPEWVARVGRPDELLALLPEADVVVVCTPLTPATERLFDARAFAAMKRGAWFVNIARGRIVDTDALVAALRAGHLAGACLDVTDPEPLPADSPLWGMPNVVLTPHVAADAELTEERIRALLVDNLRRFAAGEPLRNVVDKRAGY
jgi:phosphoglycerate dehydrogenase-like enzyme